jgi:hypothetical protein
MKALASRFGMSIDDYIALRATKKHCRVCCTWKYHSEFNNDRSRLDGRCSQCIVCSRVKVKKSRKGFPSVFKGCTHTDSARRRMSLSKRGKSTRSGWNHTLESRLKMSHKMRLSALSGALNHAFKDGKVVERRGIRFSPDYARWRYDVFTRDKFTCRRCFDASGGNLRAHHIKSFADFPSLRLKVSNGLTLCKDCHDKEHYGSKH